MKSHELAKLLLANPDQIVIIHTMNGFEEVEKIEVENNNTQIDFNDDRIKNGIYEMKKTSNDDRIKNGIYEMKKHLMMIQQ